MPTIIQGRNSYVTFRGLNMGSALANDVGLSISGEELDASTFGSNWKATEQGQSGAK